MVPDDNSTSGTTRPPVDVRTDVRPIISWRATGNQEAGKDPKPPVSRRRCTCVPTAWAEGITPCPVAMHDRACAARPQGGHRHPAPRDAGRPLPLHHLPAYLPLLPRGGESLSTEPAGDGPGRVALDAGPFRVGDQPCPPCPGGGHPPEQRAPRPAAGGGAPAAAESRGQSGAGAGGR